MNEYFTIQRRKCTHWHSQSQTQARVLENVYIATEGTVIMGAPVGTDENIKTKTSNSPWPTEWTTFSTPSTR
jgi:hypothetical protein